MSDVPRALFQEKMASGGWSRPKAAATTEEDATALPPTYFVICFHEKCTQGNCFQLIKSSLIHYFIASQKSNTILFADGKG